MFSIMVFMFFFNKDWVVKLKTFEVQIINKLMIPMGGIMF